MVYTVLLAKCCIGASKPQLVCILLIWKVYERKQNRCAINLTDRFHVAVRLFSNRSQMTSKCGKNKKVAHEPLGECVTDVLTAF